MTDREQAALKKIKDDGEIQIQLGARLITVINCHLTDKAIETKTTRMRGFIVGRKKGVGGNRAFAYVACFGSNTYNVSRAAFTLI